MALFNPNLGGVDRSSITPAPVNTSTSTLLKGAGNLIGVAAGVVKEVRRTGFVKDFAQQITDISNKKNAFDVQFKGLFDQLNTNDLGRVKELKKRLDALSNGETQGVLTPGAARLRADAAFKTALAAHPELSPEFSRIRSSTKFGAASGPGTGVSPEQAAFAKFTQQKDALMLRGGFTGDQAEQIIKLNSHAAVQSKLNEQSLAQGSAHFNSYLGLINSRNFTFSNNQIGAIQKSLKDGTYNPDTAVGDINIAANIQKQKLNAFLASQGDQLTRSQRDELRASVDSTTKMLTDIAKSRDPGKSLDRVVNKLEGENTVEFYNFFNGLGPQYSRLISTVGKEKALELVTDVIPTMLGQLGAGRKNMARLADLAAGDPDRSLALRWIQANPSLTFEGYMTHLGGSIAKDPTRAEYYRSMSAQILQHKSPPGVDSADNSKDTVFDAKLLQDAIGAEAPSTVEGMLQPGVQSKLQNDPKFKTATVRQIETRLVDMASQLKRSRSFTDKSGNPLKFTFHPDQFDTPVVVDNGFFSTSKTASRFLTLDSVVGQVPPGSTSFSGGVLGFNPSATADLTTEAKRAVRNMNTLVSSLVLAGVPRPQLEKIVQSMFDITTPSATPATPPPQSGGRTTSNFGNPAKDPAPSAASLGNMQIIPDKTK